MPQHHAPQQETQRRTASILPIALSTVAIVLVVLVYLFGNDTPRVAIVRVSEVIEKYEGSIDARKDFQKTTSAWQSNIDTLRAELQRMMFDLEQDRSAMSKEASTEREQVIRMKNEEIQQYAAAIREKATKEQTLLTDGVVNQIKSAAEVVGKEKHYDLVLAMQNDGTMLYHENVVDLTDDVMTYLRGHYKGSRPMESAHK